MNLPFKPFWLCGMFSFQVQYHPKNIEFLPYQQISVKKLKKIRFILTDITSPVKFWIVIIVNKQIHTIKVLYLLYLIHNSVNIYFFKSFVLLNYFGALFEF